jgi:hypothetical protein
MWRKRKWVIGIVLAVVVLLFGSLGSVALAQTGSTDDSSGKTLLARVAAILGIDQQKVEDAFAQAQKEMRDEALDNQLRGLVEKSKMTQEQADQYKQWWQSSPNMLGLDSEDYKGFPGGFFYGPNGFRGWHGQFGIPKTPAPSTTPSSP